MSSRDKVAGRKKKRKSFRTRFSTVNFLCNISLCFNKLSEKKMASYGSRTKQAIQYCVRYDTAKTLNVTLFSFCLLQQV